MDKEGLPKVVVLGGGTGMPVLLKGLKEQPQELAAIVTVADEGGSTGEIRKEMNMPAPGDIRKVIASLAQVDDELKALFQHRFQVDNQLSNHSVGNLVLAAMNSLTDDFYEAVDKVSELFQVKGSIFPIVNESIELHARLMDGTVISGESNIPVKNKKIQEIFITPEKVTPNPKVVQAIQEADLVVISPGSLYTSILPNMIIGGVTEAIRQTKANVVYVSNVMGQLGENEHYTTAAHVEAIYDHIGKDTIDTIVLHNQPIDKDILALYKEERSVPVPYDRERLRSYQIRIIEKDVIDYTDNVIRHNPAVLSEILFNLARE